MANDCGYGAPSFSYGPFSFFHVQKMIGFEKSWTNYGVYACDPCGFCGFCCDCAGMILSVIVIDGTSNVCQGSYFSSDLCRHIRDKHHQIEDPFAFCVVLQFRR